MVQWSEGGSIGVSEGPNRVNRGKWGQQRFKGGHWGSSMVRGVKREPRGVKLSERESRSSRRVKVGQVRVNSLCSLLRYCLKRL